MQKTTFLTLTLVSLVMLPAMAQVGEVWTDFQSYSVDLQNYLQNNLSENLKPVEPQSRSAITNATGELNIPNPITAGQRIRDDIFINSISDRFENNSVVRSNLVSNEINRLITRGAVSGLLGEAGQIRTKTKLINTEKTLRNIAGFSDVDEDRTIFQELLEGTGIKQGKGEDLISLADKVLGQGLLALLSANQETIKIQKEQSKIVAETFAQTLQTNQSLQYSNLNLANISQQMEEENRARRVDTSTEAARLLRATSQMDLFGTKIDN
ncbi:hypothetical protein FNW02_14415 [Komarekiella sp. 'clone 1']|uniref:Uncharacterized protein n=1 Tax=Komarekiella delphini-convector SJRDD-AB1 TaxID=2593771 RepID=A0AA40SXA1_9NOST|nr:hypothetical protein [Komarekiella delphini-convector]MBD6616991.1 hypothetical protein [Komarekiella delphini-convector SJRDD-AB1]